MPSSTFSDFPSLSALLRTTWQGFKARFWLVVLLTVLFRIAHLVLQMSFFGAVALSSFVDYFSKEAGDTALGIMPLFVSLSGVSLWVVVPAVSLMLVLQVWYYGSLFAAVQAEDARASAILRQGLKLFLRVAAQMAALILAVRLVYFLLVLLANFVFRYVGYAGTSTETVNRLLLLFFALMIIVAGIIAGFALFRTVDGIRNPVTALKEGVALFWRAPWRILWRGVVVLFLIYIANELVAQVQLSGIPIQWQALLSLLYLPFMLFFLSAYYRNITHRS